MQLLLTQVDSCTCAAFDTANKRGCGACLQLLSCLTAGHDRHSRLLLKGNPLCTVTPSRACRGGSGCCGVALGSSASGQGCRRRHAGDAAS